jgi:hypothetical protein
MFGWDLTKTQPILYDGLPDEWYSKEQKYIPQRIQSNKEALKEEAAHRRHNSNAQGTATPARSA